MMRLILGRVVQAGFVALVVGVLTFVLMETLPGDAAWRIAAGRYGYDMVDAAAAEAVRAELGLDRPLLVRLAGWLGDLVRLDLGRSLVSGHPVAEEVAHGLGHSLRLALTGVALSLFIGPPLGLLAARRAGGLVDRLVVTLAVAARALPSFALGIALIIVFAVQLRWLPAAGHGKPVHLILPGLTLAIGIGAMTAQVTREAALRVMASPHWRFARHKGLTAGQTLRRHGLRNIAVPVIAYLGVQFIYLIEGVIVVETLFAWPGIGHALVHAIFARDVPVIQGTALAMGLMFVALNAVVDVIVLALDPRRRTA